MDARPAKTQFQSILDFRRSEPIAEPVLPSRDVLSDGARAETGTYLLYPAPRAGRRWWAGDRQSCRQRLGTAQERQVECQTARGNLLSVHNPSTNKYPRCSAREEEEASAPSARLAAASGHVRKLVAEPLLPCPCVRFYLHPIGQVEMTPTPRRKQRENNGFFAKRDHGVSTYYSRQVP